MNRVEQIWNQFAKWTVQKTRKPKNLIWDNQNHRLVLLFFVAALLVICFTYHQYGRRNYALSSSSQRSYNQYLKNKLDKTKLLNQQVKNLQKFKENMPIDSEFERKINELSVGSITHDAQLLSNCTKQYLFDLQEAHKCDQFLDEVLEKIANNIKAP